MSGSVWCATAPATTAAQDRVRSSGSVPRPYTAAPAARHRCNPVGGRALPGGREPAPKLEQLRERLREYGLELHSEKTRLIQFGRYAAEHRERDGQGKPETFDFLGFKHICGTVHKTGRFTVRRKTIGKRMAAKLKAIKAELLRRRHEPVKDTGEWLRAVVQGYFNYHAVPGNFARLQSFRHDVIRHWWLAVRRRGQRPVGRAVFDRWVTQYLPTPAILHPYPLERIGAKYPNIQGKNRVR